MLGPDFEKMGIRRPQMIIWFIMSQGSDLIRELVKMAHDGRQAELWKVAKRLNGEFCKCVPIQ